MKHLRLIFEAACLAGGILLTQTAVATPALRCDVTYAGSTTVIETRPVADPYPVASTDIGGRFRFKSIMVGDSTRVDYIKLYAYLDTSRQPLLIQEVTYRPPFKATPKPYPLTGEQHLFAGPVERELIYSCTLAGVPS
jgi:hypothetical protein